MWKKTRGGGLSSTVWTLLCFFFSCGLAAAKVPQLCCHLSQGPYIQWFCETLAYLEVAQHQATLRHDGCPKRILPFPHSSSRQCEDCADHLGRWSNIFTKATSRDRAHQTRFAKRNHLRHSLVRVAPSFADSWLSRGTGAKKNRASAYARH